MKNLFIQHKEFLIGFILTASLLWPLFVAPFFTHHDDVQTIRLYEMDKCIKDGQIPCRFVPDLGGLYGYPLFNYYAPLPYYFGEIFYFISKNLIFSVKIMFAASFLGSYIFMFLLAQKFWGKLGGSLSAIFYSFAPYHALDLYVRGAMGELWALMFFPAILWVLISLKEKTNITNMIISSIFIAGLITSHNLSSMIFLPVAALWVLLQGSLLQGSLLQGSSFLFLKQRKQKFLWFSFASFILGILLSAFYLLPMIFEKNLVHVETTTYGYFGYTEHFKGIRELFLYRDWGWGSSIREVPGGEKEDISFQIGWIHLLGWGLAIFTAFYVWRKNKWVTFAILVSTVFILFAVVMIHPRSQVLWNLIEPLKYLQFPWRFMMIVILFISFISGASVLAFRKKWAVILWVLLITLVVGANFFYFRPEKFIQVSDKDLLEGANWDRLIKRSIFDYLPIFAKEPPAELAGERYEILTGDSKIFDFYEGSNWLSFKTQTSSHTIIRLSKYYFPNWKVFIDGQEAKIDYTSNSFGLMTITLSKGDHTVTGKLFDTQIRTISNNTTLAIGIFTILLMLSQSKKIRLWLDYYRKRVG